MSERKDLKVKKLLVTRFQKNRLPYALTLLAALLELLYSVTILDHIKVGAMMGLSTAVNIFLLFLLFLCAVKMNVYNRLWSILTLAVGCYCAVRALVLQPVLLSPTGKVALLNGLNISCAVLLLVSGLYSLNIIRRRAPYVQKGGF